MTRRALVYGLVDPRDGKVRYVGWTVDVERRLRDHLLEASRGGRSHKCHWLNVLERLGITPTVRVLELGPRGGIRSREIWWAKQFSNLTNQTPGGDIEPGGWNTGLTAATDPRVAAAAVKISVSMRGNKNCLGHKLSAERREKLRQAMTVRRSRPGFQDLINAAKSVLPPPIPWNKGLKGLAKRVGS